MLHGAPYRALLLAGLLAVPAGAQTSSRPVDQAVADVDPRATSLRKIEPGTGQFGAVEIFELQRYEWSQVGLPALDVARDLGSRQYEFSGPGIHAIMTRPDYVVRRGRDGVAFNVTPRKDGEFAEIVPANTVFNLIPSETPALRHRPQQITGPDYRIDARLDGRVGQQLAVPLEYLGQSRPAAAWGGSDDAAGSWNRSQQVAQVREGDQAEGDDADEPASSGDEAPASTEPASDATPEGEAADPATDRSEQDADRDPAAPPAK